ncbi:MAG: hypothetical protein IPJ13_10260 [Saprospiraceae bacterium]|nr:hypothetical protein [Saprospiraceae bacterium]
MYGGLTYTGQNFRGFLIQHVGKNYYSDMGFNGRIENFDPEEDQNCSYRIYQCELYAKPYHYPKESKNVNYYWSGFENFFLGQSGWQRAQRMVYPTQAFFFFKIPVPCDSDSTITLYD